MKRPRLVINMAMTADGKIASASREYPHLSSRVDRQVMERLRAQADAVLVGAGTVRAIDPPLHVRDPEALELRSRSGKPADLMHVVVSGSGRVSPTAKALTEPRAAARVLVTSARGQAPVPTGFEIWSLGDERVDLPLLMERLVERGVETALCEGGAELNWSLFAADLVDELYLTIVPTVLGGAKAPTPVGGPGFPMAGRLALRLLGVERFGDELFCHYQVDRGSRRRSGWPATNAKL